MTAKFALDEVLLDDFKDFAPDLPSGRIDAQLDVQGPLEAPTGTFSLTGRDIDLVDDEELHPLHFALDGTLEGRSLAVAGTLDTGASQDATLEARLPLRIDPDGFSLELPQSEPVSGQVKWDGDVGEIWELFGLAGHELAGRGSVDVTLSGTLEDPRMAGAIKITGGRYENFQTGTVLTPLEAELAISGEEAVLTKLSAGDGGNGRITGSGKIDIEPADHFPLSFETSINQATLVRRDDMTATAGGQLTLDGSFRNADLSGTITTDRVEISIAETLPPQVIDLDVQMVNFPDRGSSEEEPSTRVPFDLGLQLTLDMPRRVFVRGRGLDSEWSGRFDIEGSTDNPRIRGSMNLVRGTIDVIGRQFRLDQGEIAFDGSGKLDPLIDVGATSQTNGLTVRVAVTGTASDPEIKLTSVPELPQDEVVARLLFGKSASELTAFELVQVGAAVAQLTGAGGGGAGILDTARNILGVDVLRIDSVGNGEGSDPALSVGSYVSDGVFLGVKQGAARDTGSVTMDIDLTDSISVESDVSERGDSNIGVRFEWDY